MIEIDNLVGDILLFKRGESYTSKTISRLTKSEYTHVGLIVSQVSNTDMITIIESDRGIKTRLRALNIDWDNHSVYRLKYKDSVNIEEVLRLAHTYTGTKYDYFKTFGMLISLISNKRRYRFFNSNSRMICSALIDVSYYTAGVIRLNDVYIGNVTPNELLNVYEFIKIEGFNK